MMAILRGFVLLTFASAAFAAPVDKPGCSDHPLVTRMPGYIIVSCLTKDFGTHRFSSQEAGKEKSISQEGKLTELKYAPPAGGAANHLTKINLVRNYQNAFKAIGGKVIFDNPGGGHTVVQLAKGGQETFVEVKHYTTTYTVVILEKGAMAQVVTASELSTALESQGRMALYGITFDFNKAQLKPESEATLKMMAEVLKNAPGMSAYIVGHTDGVGEHAANLALSRARAEAVKEALVSRHGIKGQRLHAEGVAAMCPVATNGTEAGRELNRRVEMVKR